MALATLSYTLAEIQEVRNSSSNVVEAGKKPQKSFCKVEEAGKESQKFFCNVEEDGGKS
jgi:hypothetical protein